jgi:hypothetical protein
VGRRFRTYIDAHPRWHISAVTTGEGKDQL